MSITVDLIQGAGGVNLQINDYRVAGVQAYGGGRVIQHFEIAEDDLKRALPPEFFNTPNIEYKPPPAQLCKGCDNYDKENSLTVCAECGAGGRNYKQA